MPHAASFDLVADNRGVATISILANARTHQGMVPGEFLCDCTCMQLSLKGDELVWSKGRRLIGPAGRSEQCNKVQVNGTADTLPAMYRKCDYNRLVEEVQSTTAMSFHDPAQTF